MAVKFYQAPVTEVYAVRAQVIMQATLPSPSPTIPSGGSYPDDPADPNPSFD